MARGPRFYFSLRSPYSWLAHHDLLGLYPDVADAVEWAPFWEPDPRNERALAERGGQFPYAAMSRAKHFYILQDVARLAAARGLALKWPVDREPVWEIPHLGYLVALGSGLGREYVAAAYRARWEQGRDICSRETVGEIAAELGLNPAEVAGASDDPELRARGVELLMDVCEDGAFGVPFFVLDRKYGISGAQPTESFSQALAQAWAERNPLTVLSGNNDDGATCGPDGCN